FFQEHPAKGPAYWARGLVQVNTPQESDKVTAKDGVSVDKERKYEQASILYKTDPADEHLCLEDGGSRIN
ncbi:hypothetical protein, partial [Lactobacillus crispatus]|uniref:hypothetical protein n=1 Tax=Lactobacillus crispatus TaxID=47770 RepID=UPI001CC40D07